MCAASPHCTAPCSASHCCSYEDNLCHLRRKEALSKGRTIPVPSSSYRVPVHPCPSCAASVVAAHYPAAWPSLSLASLLFSLTLLSKAIYPTSVSYSHQDSTVNFYYVKLSQTVSTITYSLERIALISCFFLFLTLHYLLTPYHYLHMRANPANARRDGISPSAVACSYSWRNPGREAVPIT